MDNDHDEIVAQLQKLTKDVAIIQYGLGRFLGKQAHNDCKSIVKQYEAKGIKP